MNNLKKVLSITAVSVMAMALTACGAKITGVDLPEDITLMAGESVAVEAAFVTDKADLDAEKLAKLVEKAAPEFTVGDETVATYIDGQITGLKAGETTLTVVTADGSFTDELKITVQAMVTGLEAPNEIKLTLKNGEEKIVDAADAMAAEQMDNSSATLEVNILPADAGDVKLIYVSSDEKIATVDAEGKVAAVGAGECTVTIKVDGMDISAETKVIVNKAGTEGKTPAAKGEDSAQNSTNKQDNGGKTPANNSGNNASSNTNTSGGNKTPANTDNKQDNVPAPTPAPAPAPSLPDGWIDNSGNIVEGEHGPKYDTGEDGGQAQMDPDQPEW